MNEVPRPAPAAAAWTRTAMTSPDCRGSEGDLCALAAHQVSRRVICTLCGPDTTECLFTLSLAPQLMLGGSGLWVIVV